MGPLSSLQASQRHWAYGSGSIDIHIGIRSDLYHLMKRSWHFFQPDKVPRDQGVAVSCAPEVFSSSEGMLTFPSASPVGSCHPCTAAGAAPLAEGQGIWGQDCF